jgi:uncharacterized SAM-binding protein YcdF (DUF218 family)
MHHVASSVLSLVLSPINWVIVLIIAGYFFRKKFIKKLCYIAAICIFIVFSNASLFSWYVKQWQPSPVSIAAGNVYSCGIVLGGFASTDADENGYFNTASDRFIQTLKLYKLGNIRHILISGGNGKLIKKNFREGAFAKREFITMGVPDSAIYAEDKSNNTFDNALYARHILDSAQLKPPYLLITSAHHIRRASLLFKNVGLPVIPFPRSYIAGRGGLSSSSFLPRFFTVTGWEIYLKETVGYYWYRSKNKE